MSKDIIIHPNKYKVYIDEPNVTFAIVRGELTAFKKTGVLIFLPANRAFPPKLGNVYQANFTFNNRKSAKIWAQGEIQSLITMYRNLIEDSRKKLSLYNSKLYCFLEILDNEFGIKIEYDRMHNKFM